MTDDNCLYFTYGVERYDFINAGGASSEIKNKLKNLGIASDIIRKIAVSSYEAEINIAIHSVGGDITLVLCEDQVQIIAKDTGPGIEDVEMAMKEGYTTASDVAREHGFGAGMGLPNMKRFCDEMNISSQIDVGTEIKMVFLI